jgi:hypothetical protein
MSEETTETTPTLIPVFVRRPWGVQTLTWVNPAIGANREQRRALEAKARRRRAR